MVVLASTFPRWKDDTVPRFVLDFVERLQPFVGKITVVAPHYKGAKHRETLATSITVRRFYYAFPFRFENVAYGEFKKTRFYPLKMFLYVTSELLTTLIVSLRLKPKVLNAHWLIPQGFVAVLIAPITGSKSVISVHGSDVFTLNGQIMRKVKRFALKHADIVIANSSATAAACQELWPNREYYVIPMGIDIKKFENQKIMDRGQYKLLFVGRLVRNKGVKYLCEAFRLLSLKYNNMHLDIIGDGPERAMLEEYIHESKLEDIVTFVGWVQASELPKYYAKADVFVGPSIEDENGAKEALGLVFAEASAMGLPVVGSDVGGIKDVVKNRVTGLLVPQKDPQALSQALEYIYTHPNESIQMGKQGRDYVSAHFSWDSVIRRYLDLIMD